MDRHHQQEGPIPPGRSNHIFLPTNKWCAIMLQIFYSLNILMQANNPYIMSKNVSPLLRPQQQENLWIFLPNVKKNKNMFLFDIWRTIRLFWRSWSKVNANYLELSIHCSRFQCFRFCFWFLQRNMEKTHLEWDGDVFWFSVRNKGIINHT